MVAVKRIESGVYRIEATASIIGKTSKGWVIISSTRAVAKQFQTESGTLLTFATKGIAVACYKLKICKGTRK